MSDTPRTDDLMREIELQEAPYHNAYERAVELARDLERSLSEAVQERDNSRGTLAYVMEQICEIVPGAGRGYTSEYIARRVREYAGQLKQERDDLKADYLRRHNDAVDRGELLREWLHTEMDPQDDEYGPWIESFTERVNAALATEGAALSIPSAEPHDAFNAEPPCENCAAILRALKDPVAVHANMLRGIIAPITMRQAAHIEGEAAVTLLNRVEAEKLVNGVGNASSLPTDDSLPEARADMLARINATHALLSLLYDLDLMPEQVEEGGAEEERMFKIADHWLTNEAINRTLDDASRRDAARYRWVRATGGPVVECAGEALDEAADRGIDTDLAKIPGAIDPRTSVPSQGNPA